jgi:hypothetical protein
VSEATPLHNWLSPRLASLVRDAEQAGFARAAVVAVIIDMITSAPYDEATPDPEPAADVTLPQCAPR